MQSAPVNRTALWIGLLLMNGAIIAFVRPVHLLGIAVMNITAITTTMIALHYWQKHLRR